MKQNVKNRLSSSKREDNQSGLVLLSAAFVLGGVFAFFLAKSLSGGGSNALSAYITDFLTTLAEGSLQQPQLLSTIWSVFRWPLLALLCSLTTFGLVGIPALFALRGFLLSFCIAAFAQVLGRQGLLFALMLLGVESFISVPVLFLLGTKGLALATTGKSRRGSRKIFPSEDSLLPYTLSLALLILCTLWELLFLPLLLSGAVQALPIL